MHCVTDGILAYHDFTVMYYIGESRAGTGRETAERAGESRENGAMGGEEQGGEERGGEDSGEQGGGG
jgi:hypothetical protein